MRAPRYKNCEIYKLAGERKINTSVSISVSLHLRRADRVGTVIPPKRRQGGGGTHRRVGDYERSAGNHINDGVDGDGTVRGRAGRRDQKRKQKRSSMYEYAPSRPQLATARTLAVITTTGLRGLGDEGYSQRGAWECTRVQVDHHAFCEETAIIIL
jgi:hypothetical protein